MYLCSRNVIGRPMCLWLAYHSMFVKARSPLSERYRLALTNDCLSCLYLSCILLKADIDIYWSSKFQAMVCSKGRPKSTFTDPTRLASIYLTWNSSLKKWLSFLKVASLIWLFPIDMGWSWFIFPTIISLSNLANPWHLTFQKRTY